MRAVRCSNGRVDLVDVPRPEGEGIRLRTRSAGICGSDLHMVSGPFAPAHTLGHEIAGVLPDGRAVAIEPLAACGHCDACTTGDYQLCREGLSTVLGIGRDGGMAEEVVVPERAIVPLPAGVDVADACLVEPLAVAIHGLRRAGVRNDLRVAVVGGGTIGLCAVAAVIGLGAPVALVARHDSQREAGARLGAAEASGEYDVVIDAAGTASALAKAVGLAKPGGTLLLLATYWDGFEIPAFDVCLREIRIVPASLYGRGDQGRDIDSAAQLLGSRPEIPDILITHRFPLEGVAEAFATAADRSSGAIKVVLEP
ncbi:MAG: alcohol dehydrogenase catalytic domain-containing protein [Myxococcota bacterium]